MADSWLTDGNCRECRRRNYCHKLCRAAKDAELTMLSEAFVKTCPELATAAVLIHDKAQKVEMDRQRR